MKHPSAITIAGIDEAGRGPWAGPVFAAAVILDPARPIAGLGDSKKLAAGRRAALEPEIIARAAAFCVAQASAAEIDALNIRRATHLAMQRALAGLSVTPGLALIDGNDAPALPCVAHTIIGGDATEPAISAASILAKVARDRLMEALCAQYPGYGFARHKGYGTAAHAQALAQLGPCPEHRRSFAPVRAALVKDQRPVG